MFMETEPSYSLLNLSHGLVPFTYLIKYVLAKTHVCYTVLCFLYLFSSI